MPDGEGPQQERGHAVGQLLRAMRKAAQRADFWKAADPARRALQSAMKRRSSLSVGFCMAGHSPTGIGGSCQSGVHPDVIAATRSVRREV
ncbi:hypothetical protein GCM10010449_84240 [Streptomyces rectiviolaceus]|uniref:Uncharacterized protein n=1 Tax=Streptomyces rectiviolaceus TaxID=332591 RepID=A0ABP6NP42_9ACTN